MNNLSTIFLYLLGADCVIGLYAFFAKRLDKDVLPLLLAVACSLADELLAHYFKVKYRNNLAIYHFGGAIEYALFAWFIKVNVKNVFVKKVIAISIGGFVGLTFIYGYWFVKEAYADPFSAVTHHNYFIMAKGLLLTIFSICYFKGIFDSISRYEYLKVYTLLAVSGILFYYAFSTVYFAADTYLVGLSLKENPNLFIDIAKRKIAAFTYAYAQLRDIKVFLFLTNMLLYLCALVVFCKNAFGEKNTADLQF